MNFKIDALEGYFGGKGGSGTYQKIINLIPPHKTLVVPFLGHCGITRNIKPCNTWYLNDINSEVVDAWKKYSSNNKKSFANSTNFYRKDWRTMFREYLDREDVVFYIDPPYLHETRKSNHKYPFELQKDDHIELLKTLKKFNFAKIIISCYDNELYADYLKDWNKISFSSRTRQGSAIETVYFNFEKPDYLHDWSYMGENYRERTAYKRALKRMVDKFDRMTPLEQNYFKQHII